jgi:hypothetical protein
MRRVDPGCRPAGATMLGDVPADCANADVVFERDIGSRLPTSREGRRIFSHLLTRGAWAGRSRDVIVIAAVRTMAACF